MVSVFLFVPNLIGYSRIILALIAFYFMLSDPVLATCLYLLSSLLDSLDGHAARLLNQCSKFGMMLDMLTDRCSTMCLLVNLSLLYPRYVFLFQLSMILDISSHWLHLHSAMMKGSSSHKKIDLSGNPILRVYYTNSVRPLSARGWVVGGPLPDTTINRNKNRPFGPSSPLFCCA
ncbi:CDP-diacylglycerol--inositol 3-phosphatidyltransferase [Chiloscyllium plagiosum]|uniref:CDP-diacylglycerol--inositol 3-phosphatidyltransferase n=1 Tax=Chiloscyllium plagiosum TaxID=36176 RepID=UPI001CB85256|nr:CDP-diacylglycerol--inositol 3-phosphatidyltransferase [Chiloscyllium plagiosum]